MSARPQAQVQTKWSFSLIWVVPLVALIIGGWLAYKALSEKGPTITITFENASGIQANKTLIKVKEVEIGIVKDVELLEDLSGVKITEEMDKSVEHLMTDETKFWIVQARVAAGQISGLGTIFSGVYLGCLPSNDGEPTKIFTGLESPPALTQGLPGRHFYLKSETLGSLDLDSPVYYRGIKVGQVVDYHFNEKAESVVIQIFINAPYHEKLFENSRFWNISGFDFSMDADGISLDSASLISILLGGVEFDLRKHDFPGALAEENQTFQLYPNHESSREDFYAIKRYYLMYFDHNVRGLSIGAPVEIRGIKIGEVTDVELQFDISNSEFHIPVMVIVEPERIKTVIQNDIKFSTPEERSELLEGISTNESFEPHFLSMIENGFRAQLKKGNILTGQMYVDLDFYPEAAPEKVRKEGEYFVIPTITAPLEQIVERVDHILKSLEQVPFATIGGDLMLAIEELTATLEEVKKMTSDVSRDTVPKINDSLDQIQKTLQGIDDSLGPNSSLNYKVNGLVDELSRAVRSIRSLLDYLERDPQALILGKEKNSDD
jgi:paraquat-inducible protein B